MCVYVCALSQQSEGEVGRVGGISAPPPPHTVATAAPPTTLLLLTVATRTNTQTHVVVSSLLPKLNRSLNSRRIGPRAAPVESSPRVKGIPVLMRPILLSTGGHDYN